MKEIIQDIISAIIFFAAIYTLLIAGYVIS